VTGPELTAAQPSPTTAWARSRQTPLRQFLRTETGSALVLLAATLIALAWANADSSGYATVWGTPLSIRIGSAGLADDLRGWVNSGLMAFFFLVAGLEARREYDMGELRERRRLTLPLVVGLGGMVLPIGIYLVINAGRPTAAGWGAAASTDTAFALGMLALVGSGVPDRVRTYLLTFAIVDDVAGIVIIAVVYSGPGRADHRTGHPGRGRAGQGQGRAPGRRLRAARSGGLDRALQIRRRPDRGRPGDGAARARPPGQPQ
jgi:hypothetical protein